MIDVQHLTKRYGTRTAVDDVSFTCQPGAVTGFLGPNGAGKSTTMRMLTGLTPPSAGSATIAGHAYADLPNPGRLVGVMLDAAAQHPGRTGRETLRLSARLLGMGAERVEEVLDLVDLGGAAGRAVGEYSLGMRQRLGIAGALLGDPAVLVLDEPANGMDPAGIRWMRDVLRGFARRGGAVLLSSHLLGEVQSTADHLVVIRGGRIVADDTLQGLLRGQGTTVRGLDSPALAGVLRRAGLPVGPGPDGALRVEASAGVVGRVALVAGQVLVELREDNGLEDVFFRLTGDPDADR